MHFLTKILCFLFLSIFLSGYLYPWFLSNIGNLYLVKGLLDHQQLAWEKAVALLQLSVRYPVLGDSYIEKLTLREQRAVAFVDKSYHDYTHNEFSICANTPKYFVNQVIDDKFSLLGYDFDERTFEFNERFDIWFYWKETGSENVHTEHLLVENLIINGGFEKTIEIGGDIPLGFARERFSRYQPPFLHRRVVVYEGREHLPTLCAQLDNSVSEASPSGYYSSAITCDENTFYLVSGWVWGVQTKFNGDHKEISIGLAFPGIQIPTEKQNAMLSPIASKNNWTHYAGILKPPPNATVMRAQLINWGTGIVCFDDVMVIPLELPEE